MGQIKQSSSSSSFFYKFWTAYGRFLIFNPIQIWKPNFHKILNMCVFLEIPIYVWTMSTAYVYVSAQFSSVTHSCPTLCYPMKWSMPGLPVHHQHLEFTQTHVHCVSDAIRPSHPLSSPSLPALNLSQHQGLFKWVSSLHQVAKLLEFQLQHQSFQWKPRTDFL